MFGPLVGGEMYLLFITFLIYGGPTPTSPSPWIHMAGQYNDLKACETAGMTIAQSPAFARQPTTAEYICVSTVGGKADNGR